MYVFPYSVLHNPSSHFQTLKTPSCSKTQCLHLLRRHGGKNPETGANTPSFYHIYNSNIPNNVLHDPISRYKTILPPPLNKLTA